MARYPSLTWEQIRTIRLLLSRDLRQKDIARLYNISPTTVSHIKTRRIYADVPDEAEVEECLREIMKNLDE